MLILNFKISTQSSYRNIRKTMYMLHCQQNLRNVFWLDHKCAIVTLRESAKKMKMLANGLQAPDIACADRAFAIENKQFNMIAVKSATMNSRAVLQTVFFKNCWLQTMRRKCTQYSYRAPSSLHATVLVSANVSGIIKLPNSIYGDAIQNRYS